MICLCLDLLAICLMPFKDLSAFRSISDMSNALSKIYLRLDPSDMSNLSNDLSMFRYVGYMSNALSKIYLRSDPSDVSNMSFDPALPTFQMFKIGYSLRIFKPTFWSVLRQHAIATSIHNHN